MRSSKTNDFVRQTAEAGMTILFLDFDGVINSAKSVTASIQRRIANPSDTSPINEDLCPGLCRNLQSVLDAIPEVRIVISSSWRLFYSIEWLEKKLASYGIDSSRMIDVTPLVHEDQSNRGDDITAWLDKHPEVRNYVIVDDVDDMTVHKDRVILTNYSTGLTFEKAQELVALIKTPIIGRRSRSYLSVGRECEKSRRARA